MDVKWKFITPMWGLFWGSEVNSIIEGHLRRTLENALSVNLRGV